MHFSMTKSDDNSRFSSFCWLNANELEKNQLSELLWIVLFCLICIRMYWFAMMCSYMLHRLS